MNELLRRIQYLSFVLVEANLYLDTHPMDIIALNYYHNYKAIYNQAVSEYTSRYGPLTPGTVESRNRWTWIDKPWPWEGEA